MGNGKRGASLVRSFEASRPGSAAGGHETGAVLEMRVADLVRLDGISRFQGRRETTTSTSTQRYERYLYTSVIRVEVGSRQRGRVGG